MGGDDATDICVAIATEQYPGSEDKYEGEWVNPRDSCTWLCVHSGLATATIVYHGFADAFARGGEQMRSIS